MMRKIKVTRTLGRALDEDYVLPGPVVYLFGGFLNAGKSVFDETL